MESDVLSISSGNSREGTPNPHSPSEDSQLHASALAVDLTFEHSDALSEFIPSENDVEPPQIRNSCDDIEPIGSNKGSKTLGDYSKDLGLLTRIGVEGSIPDSSCNHREGRKKKQYVAAGSRAKRSATERSAKKQKLVEEKAAKRSANEMNKVYKPGECMKFMNIEIHPELSEVWYMADLPREASAANTRIRAAPDMCDPALLLWTRNIPPKLTTDGAKVQLTPKREQCSQGLYVMTADEVSSYVAGQSLSGKLKQLVEMTACTITLVIYGVKDYFKSGRKTANSNKKMSEIDLEMALTDLLVSAKCDALKVNSPNELALLIVQITKSIAEAPYKEAKRACDEQADFYMRGDNKKCVPVDKDGNGVGRLWQQMIAILPLSSLETSRALCASYKTPYELYQALQEPDSINKVADIGVARAAVPGSKLRRIGPEFARKLHTLFTSEDGNTLVD